MGGGAASLPESQFCAALAAAQCDRVVTCGQVAPAERALCQAMVETPCRQGLRDAARASPGSYDPVRGAACVAAVPEHPCGLFNLRSLPQACFTLPFANPPQVNAGAACDPTAGPVCLPSQAYCAPPSGAGCGVCTAYPNPGTPLGGVCDAAARRCHDGGWCEDPEDGGPTRCAPVRADGQYAPLGEVSCRSGTTSTAADGGWVCGRPGPAASCWGQCVDGYFCSGFDPFAFTAGTCNARIARAAPCTNRVADDGCAIGDTCLDGVCQLDRLNSRDAGAECEFWGQCRNTETCVFDGGTQRLRQGVCVARFPVDAGCTFSQDCVTSAACVGGRCRTLGGPGAPCGFSVGSCRTVLSCESPGDGGVARCELPPGPGARCSFASCVAVDGGALACLLDGGQQGTCGVPLPDGADCFDDRMCQSRRCGSASGSPPLRCLSSCLP